MLMDGTNTIVIPETTPEAVRGIMTLVIVCHELHPRSWDASMYLLSNLVIDVNMGKTVYGRKSYTIPKITANGLYCDRIFVKVKAWRVFCENP